MSSENISKGQWRSELLQRRRGQDRTEAAERSAAAQNFLLQADAWHKAQKVGLYIPISGEVDTDLLCKNAWETGKEVYLPRCRPGEEGLMDFVFCRGHEDLLRGSYNILEPKPEIAAPEIESIGLDILLLPGVGYDKTGYRLGFGGGFYDRFLAALLKQKTLFVGFGYSWQIVEALPHEPWDIPVHVLLSDSGMQWI